MNDSEGGVLLAECWRLGNPANLGEWRLRNWADFRVKGMPHSSLRSSSSSSSSSSTRTHLVKYEVSTSMSGGRCFSLLMYVLKRARDRKCALPSAAGAGTMTQPLLR
eukprot:CAMPEP_0118938826 /NCGR_PEP_ID=MMETSP1169-20130426/27214_1 /TAXON_ID=36882 /ORGANISM="Pyramimonas obovata, Strain CCMP722" /LENGTH=106 /DNA_ID=CAMNT_0006882915 /DNA_START=30 /DNA_END=346 /DNA_ORIENTATION=-